MKYLIALGMNNSNETDVAQYISERISKSGVDIAYLSTYTGDYNIDKSDLDAVILIGTQYQDKYTDNLYNFIISNLKTMELLPTLLVSIGNSSPCDDDLAVSQLFADQLFAVTRFQPSRLSLLNGVAQNTEILDLSSQINQIESTESPDIEPNSRRCFSRVQLDSDISTFYSLVNGTHLVEESVVNVPLPVDVLQADRVTNPKNAPIRAQIICVYCGETVGFNIAGLFEDQLDEFISFIPVDLPSWLDLEISSGEIRGVVPTRINNSIAKKFDVYALDSKGKSVKAVLEFEFLGSQSGPGLRLCDHKISEGCEVRIDTAYLFKDRDLKFIDIQFSAVGIPNGLLLEEKTGVISGIANFGTSKKEPHNVIIAAIQKYTNKILSKQLKILITKQDT